MGYILGGPMQTAECRCGRHCGSDSEWCWILRSRSGCPLRAWYGNHLRGWSDDTGHPPCQRLYETGNAGPEICCCFPRVREVYSASAKALQISSNKVVKLSNHDIVWLLIGTCCIDRESSVELTEAIHSMHKCCKNNIISYVYLIEVL